MYLCIAPLSRFCYPETRRFINAFYYYYYLNAIVICFWALSIAFLMVLSCGFHVHCTLYTHAYCQLIIPNWYALLVLRCTQTAEERGARDDGSQ